LVVTWNPEIGLKERALLMLVKVIEKAVPAKMTLLMLINLKVLPLSPHATLLETP
jgi:hypothetical protein